MTSLTPNVIYVKEYQPARAVARLGSDPIYKSARADERLSVGVSALPWVLLAVGGIVLIALSRK